MATSKKVYPTEGTIDYGSRGAQYRDGLHVYEKRPGTTVRKRGDFANQKVQAEKGGVSQQPEGMPVRGKGPSEAEIEAVISKVNGGK